MKFRSLMVLVAWACTASAFAQGPAAVRKQAESSMLVTGTVDVEADGSVSGYQIDKPQALPEAVTSLLGQAVPSWRFEPVLVNGRPSPVRARMSVRLAARKREGGEYMLSVRSASFGEEPGDAGETVSARQMKPPSYPMAAAQIGVHGMAYLLLKIGRDGSVEDVFAEQVNLRVIGNERQMQQARKLLADASIRAARNWTFNPPIAGDEVDAPFWIVRVPVDYRLNDKPEPAYGQWEGYVPGPLASAPWIMPTIDSAGSPDALVSGGIYRVGRGPRLLTLLGGHEEG